MRVEELDIVIPVVSVARASRYSNLWVHGVGCEEAAACQGTPQFAPELRKSLSASGFQDHNAGEVLIAKMASKRELISKSLLDPTDVSPLDYEQPVLYIAGPLYKSRSIYRDIFGRGGRLGLRVRGKVAHSDGDIDGCAIDSVEFTSKPASKSAKLGSLSKVLDLQSLAKSQAGILPIVDLPYPKETIPDMRTTVQDVIGHDDAALIIDLAAANGLCRKSLITEFEVNPEAIPVQAIRRLRDQLQGIGKLEKSLVVVDEIIAPQKAGAIIEKSFAAGLISANQVTQFELNPSSFSQTDLKRLERRLGG